MSSRVRKGGMRMRRMELGRRLVGHLVRMRMHRHGWGTQSKNKEISTSNPLQKLHYTHAWVCPKIRSSRVGDRWCPGQWVLRQRRRLTRRLGHQDLLLAPPCAERPRPCRRDSGIRPPGVQQSAGQPAAAILPCRADRRLLSPFRWPGACRRSGNRSGCPRGPSWARPVRNSGVGLKRKGYLKKLTT